MTERKHTDLHMEAALCLWEAMLDINMRGWERDPENDHRNTSLEPLIANHASLYRTWVNVGTVEMRHMAVHLADFLLQTWDALTEDEQQDLIPYDWEFVPAFLAQIEWDDGGSSIHPSEPRVMAEDILKAQKDRAHDP